MTCALPMTAKLARRTRLRRWSSRPWSCAELSQLSDLGRCQAAAWLSTCTSQRSLADSFSCEA